MNALFRNYAKMYLFIYIICKLRVVRHNYLSLSTVLVANYSTNCKGSIKSKKNNYPLLMLSTLIFILSIYNNLELVTSYKQLTDV